MDKWHSRSSDVPGELTIHISVCVCAPKLLPNIDICMNVCNELLRLICCVCACLCNTRSTILTWIPLFSREVSLLTQIFHQVLRLVVIVPFFNVIFMCFRECKTLNVTKFKLLNTQHSIIRFYFFFHLPFYIQLIEGVKWEYPNPFAI